MLALTRKKGEALVINKDYNLRDPWGSGKNRYFCTKGSTYIP